MSPLRIRPLGGAPGCLVMILVSIALSVLLTVLINLGTLRVPVALLAGYRGSPARLHARSDR